MYYAQIVYSDGTKEILPLNCRETENGFAVTLPKSTLQKPAEYADFMPDFCKAKEGENGYYTFCNNLTKFVGHKDGEADCGYGMMRFFGAKTEKQCICAIATGLWAQTHVIIEKKDGIYRIFFRFMLDGCDMEEDACVKFVNLSGENADYNGMAKAYRAEMVKEYDLKPLTARANEQLQYVMDAPEIRIRMGWKPVPTPVPEQTHENEPEMHVACTFDDVIGIMEACKAKGVHKAEFCLVGWNVKGHDGRWPETFPVEPAFGGEAGLKKLIARAKELGYKLVCHTNATDCYTIAETFHDELPMRTREQKWATHANWGGGQMYDTCPVNGNAENIETLKKCAELGFSGVHYIDVISTVPPRRCFSPKHPLSQMGYVQGMRELGEASKEIFGGFQSEGGFDYMAPCLDMGLYIDFHMADKANAFCDDNIPMWQLVYHDYILANPGTTTVNYPAKGWFSRLKFIEFGGHPVIYIYSKFHKLSKWMGEEDFTLDNAESVARSAESIKALQDDYEKVRAVRWEEMVKHEEVTDTLHVVTYANGVKIACNYAENDAVYEGVPVPAHDMAVIAP